MFKRICAVILVMFFAIQIGNAGQLTITEQLLIQADSPILKMYKSEELDRKIDLLKFENKFESQIDASIYHKIDNQKGLSKSGYDKPFTDIHNVDLSISKKFMFGASVKIKASNDGYTNPFITNSTSNSLGVEIGLDLINELLHKNTQNFYLLSKDRLKLQKNIRQYKTYLFKNNLRKLYWNLMTNKLSLNVLKSLLKNTKKQVSLIYKKYKASVSDLGDYSRMKAQQKSTEALIISYSYQKEQLIKALKEVLPKKLSKQTISINSINLEESINEIKSCTFRIASIGLKYDNSLLTSQNLLLNNINQIKNKIDKNSSDFDIKLVSNFDRIGKAFTAKDSISDFMKNGKSSYSIGLQLSYPLGKIKEKIRNLQLENNELRNKASLQKNIARMKAYHEQTISMITLLNQAIKNQAERSILLKTSLKSSREKYKQARISIEQLILEENNSLQSELNIISTKSSVVSTILEYFDVFNKTPCKFNKIK